MCVIKTVWLTYYKRNRPAASSYSRWLWVLFAGIVQTCNITQRVLEYTEMGFWCTWKTLYNWPHIICQEYVKLVWCWQGPPSLRILNRHIFLKICDNMLHNIFNNSYKIAYNLSDDQYCGGSSHSLTQEVNTYISWQIVHIINLILFIPYILTLYSHHLFWHFSQFLGHGLPAANVSRQLSYYKVRIHFIHWRNTLMSIKKKK